jgi:hypothetical protein
LQTNFLFVLVSQRGCLLVLTFLPFMLHTSLSGFFLTWGFSKYATSIYHADWHTNNGEREREKEAVASVSTMERERVLLPVYLHFTEAWRQNPYTVDFCLEFISRVADLMVSRSMKHNTHT